MENINELVAALAKARKEFPAIEKTETATIKGKTKSGQPYEYSYDYAPLAEILDKTAGPLSDSGLVLVEQITETTDGTQLTVIIAHSSGQTLTSEKLLGTFNDPKLFGGAMTYYRRYLIEGLLNIASQQDKDAQGVESQSTPRKQPKPAQPKQEKKPAPTSPDELMTLANETLDLEKPYISPVHMLNAIKKHTGAEDYAWPAPDDVNGWKFAYKQLADYNAAKAEADQIADDILNG